MELHVRRRRNGLYEKADVLAAAYRVQFTSSREFVGERKGIGNVAPFAQRDHRPEDSPVSLAVEHRVVHMLCGPKYCIGVHEHCRYNRLLRISGVRRLAVAVRITSCRGDREVYGRAGHLPMWVASTRCS